MQTKAVLVLSSVLAFCSATAFAQTTWVVDQGGAGDFTTIQACVAAAAAGDTCQVNAGTYAGSLLIQKGLTLIAPDGPDATIIRPGPPYPYDAFNIPVLVYGSGAGMGPVVIDGFTLRDGVFSAGGGLLVTYGTVTVRNCIITNNYAGLYAHVPIPFTERGGGGIYAEYSNLTVEDSVISTNTSSHTMFHMPRGGGIYAWDGQLTVTNCLIEGNHSSHGGGAVYLTSSANATFTNCTITENTDNLAIAGIQVVAPASATVVNSILWNTGTEITGTATVTYSNVEGGLAGTGNLDADPLFVGSGNYRLLPNSPCLDAGTNSAPLLLPHDLDGQPRALDGDCDNLFTVDMGAYELYVPCQWPIAATAGNGSQGTEDARSSLPLNGLLPLFVPLAGLLLWRGFRRNR